MIPFSKKKLKKVRKPGCPLRKTDKYKMAVCWGTNIFSNFGLYFLAESVLLDDFHAKEFIF